MARKFKRFLEEAWEWCCAFLACVITVFGVLGAWLLMVGFFLAPIAAAGALIYFVWRYFQ